MSLANLVRVVSTTTGTGTLTLGAAVTGFLTSSQAGMTNGDVYSYAIEADYVTVGDDLVPTSREVGTGTYTSAGTTLTRSVINSTNSNALLNLTGDEQVIITIGATSLGNLSLSGDASTSSTTGALTVAGGVGIGGKLYGTFADLTTGGTSGTLGLNVSTTTSAPNSSDVSDKTFNASYLLFATSATNHNISRGASFSFANYLTGGGHVQTTRVFDIFSTTAPSAVTDQIQHIYITGTNSGTITSSFGLYIGPLAGTSVFGIADTNTSSVWSHAGTTPSTSSTTGALTVAGGVGIGGSVWLGAPLNLSGGVTGNAPQAQMDFGSYYDNAGNISASHIALFGGGTYGFGISLAQLNYITAGGHFFYKSSDLANAEFTVSTDGNIVVNSAAIATNATNGFLYIPTCAGTPTGTPTTFTGRIPMVYDTTNHQFWFYDSGWKQPKTPAGAATVTWQ